MRQLKLVWGSPGLRGGPSHLVPRLLDTQRQLEVEEELGTEPGPTGWIWLRAGSWEGKGELWLVPRDYPWPDSGSLGLGGSHGWEHKETFYGSLDSSSIAESLLHGSPWPIPMKRDSSRF